VEEIAGIAVNHGGVQSESAMPRRETLKKAPVPGPSRNIGISIRKGVSEKTEGRWIR